MKQVMALIICIALMITFTGCKGSKAGAFEDSEVSGNKENSGKVLEGEKEAERFDLKGEAIRIAMWWDDTPKNDEQRALVKSIEEKYNCKIEYVNIPYDSYIGKLNASVLSGEPIADILYIEVSRAIPALVKAGIIMPVDEYFDFSDPKWPSILKQTGTYAGKQYGFNCNSWDGAGIYYNKELIDKAGTADPFELQQRGEWDWDAFLETAKATTMDTDGDGAVDKWGLAVQVYNFFHPLILSNNADILKISDEGKAEFTLDTSNGIEALQFYSDLYNKHGVVMIPPDADEYKWLAAPKAFAQGKVAMFYGQPWDGVDIKKEMKTEYGFVLFPKGPKASENIVPIRNESKIYVMPKGAKHPKEAAKIYEELMSFNRETDFLAFKEWMGNGFYSDKYLPTVDKMVDKGRLSMAAGFQIFENSLQNMIINDLIKSNTPADVFVKEIKDDCQKAIDDEF